MLLFLVPLAGLMVFLTPSVKTRFIIIVYFLLLFLFLWGVEGFLYSGKPSQNERYAFTAFFIFLVALHIPLIIRLTQIDFKKHKIKNARGSFGRDILHLDDEQLHRHLEH